MSKKIRFRHREDSLYIQWQLYGNPFNTYTSNSFDFTYCITLMQRHCDYHISHDDTLDSN